MKWCAVMIVVVLTAGCQTSPDTPREIPGYKGLDKMQILVKGME